MSEINVIGKDSTNFMHKKQSKSAHKPNKKFTGTHQKTYVCLNSARSFLLRNVFGF